MNRGGGGCLSDLKVRNIPLPRATRWRTWVLVQLSTQVWRLVSKNKKLHAGSDWVEEHQWKQMVAILGNALGDEHVLGPVTSLFLGKITDGLAHGNPETINITPSQF